MGPTRQLSRSPATKEPALPGHDRGLLSTEWNPGSHRERTRGWQDCASRQGAGSNPFKKSKKENKKSVETYKIYIVCG